VGGCSRDGSVGNIAVSEGLNSGSVVVDAATKDCLDSVSCGYVSYGRSIATTKKLVSVGGRSRDGPCFGRRSAVRSVGHTSPGTHQLLHMCWEYLSPQERVSMATAYPIMWWDYARMRRDACLFRTTISEALRAPRPVPAMVPALCPFCTWFMGAALLSTYPRFTALFISGLMLGFRSYAESDLVDRAERQRSVDCRCFYEASS
jgi:hypothetical protein